MTGLEPYFPLICHGERVTTEKDGPSFAKGKRKPKINEEIVKGCLIALKKLEVSGLKDTFQGSEKHYELLPV